MNERITRLLPGLAYVILVAALVYALWMIPTAVVTAFGALIGFVVGILVNRSALQVPLWLAAVGLVLLLAMGGVLGWVIGMEIQQAAESTHELNDKVDLLLEAQGIDPGEEDG